MRSAYQRVFNQVPALSARSRARVGLMAQLFGKRGGDVRGFSRPARTIRRDPARSRSDPLRTIGVRERQKTTGWMKLCFDDHLQRSGARGMSKGVVGVKDAIENEPVGDQDLGTNLARLNGLEQQGHS
jgi:hypothetical protein